MSKKVVLPGHYPPPRGVVSVYVGARFGHLESRGLRPRTYGDREARDPFM